jgi:hypothetical protein
MTHRQVLELAARLSEHALDVVQTCRGIPAGGLRRYWDANEARSRIWSSLLLGGADDLALPVTSPGAGRVCHLRAVFEEIATSGILVRVASTILHAIGSRLDIPLARDIAVRTAQAHGRIREAAIACVVVRAQFSPQDLESLDRLGRLSDRMSDLLCGAMMPHLKSDRFVVDPERAADYAETFARRPALIQVPVHRASRGLPDSCLPLRDLAEEVERALLECLPRVARFRSSLPNSARVLRGMLSHPHGQESAAGSAQSGGAHCGLGAGPTVAFPTLSFSSMLGRTRKAHHPE